MDRVKEEQAELIRFSYRELNQEQNCSPDYIVCDPAIRRRFMEIVRRRARSKVNERDILLRLLSLRKTKQL